MNDDAQRDQQPLDDPADGLFGETVAAGYDSDDGAEFDPAVVARTVDVLHDLAEGGPALELAIGTGRIAAPLAARGTTVHGIELSRAMARRIDGKPGAERIHVTIGDMTRTRADGDIAPGEFALAYLVFNTISNVTTQDGQVDVFRNAAAHLRPGGRFLVEVGVPGLRRLPPGQDTVPFAVETTGEGLTSGYVGFDQYDVATQRFRSVHVRVSDDGAGRVYSVPFRYAWPAEMDLMARIAGMRLVDRWADWDGSPFTADSEKHVSVWQKD
ncbi:class I SAM-dependent methyltransferase [Myceligenerans pegani]|uniref:class I SAM-dependent methyltransferase n=1 Tax=Myceligenerans pegani TaxID=2776917 RepID=UPI00299DCAEC|nr:class I SAM-dependent methyltransferase [Myceligenerans sp. TRM 65318]